MRRSVLTSVALLSVFLAGCEDGPNQTYSPAPAGAATSWNNAGPDASYNDPATQTYEAGGGGTNAVNVCNAAEQNVEWSKAFTAPIIPPFGVGGIDLSAGGTFTSVTIEDVINGTSGQAKLCQGSPGACTDGSSDVGYAWGPSLQLNTCYDSATHQLTFFLMLPGYDGTLSFTLPHLYNGQPVPLAVDSTGAAADLNYVWQVGQPIMVNGAVLTGPNGSALWNSGGINDTVANQMYLGLMYTFQRTLIAVTNPTTNPPLTEMTDPNSDCLANAKCRTSINGDLSQGNFGARSVGMYFDAAESQSADPASAAEPGDLYIFPVKFEPYSLAPYNEGLDAFASPNSDPTLLFNGAAIYGPYSPAGVLSPPGTPQKPFCTLYMGESWGQFTNDCVNVSGNAGIDATSMAKLLGAQHHEAEWFQFSVVGVNQNFSADPAELTQNGVPGVLQDSLQQPADDDLATDFYVDVRSSGAKLNDQRGDSVPASPVSNPACAQDPITNACPAACTMNDCLAVFEDVNLAGEDLHGTAAVMGYFRALVQDAIKAQMITYGITPQADPTQCWFDSTPYTTPVTLAKALQSWVAPSGCTGFEQMVIPANPIGGSPPPYTDTLDVTVEGTFPRSIFQPGDPELDFYADPVNFAGENNNVSAPNLFQAALSQVTAILGHGNVNALPPNTRDWRFYFQYWAQAFTGYLLNRSLNPTWHDLYNDSLAAKHKLRQVNQDDLFFDLNNGLDKFEYVDRTAASTLGAPVDFEYDILLPTSNTQTNNFYQRLTRGESAIYQAMLTADATGSKTGQVPGSNGNVFLSDLFGSPAIVDALNAAGTEPLFGGAVDMNGDPIPGKDAYYCATTFPVDPDCPNGPPVDENGNLLVDGIGEPLFTNYRGIFTGTTFTIGSDLPIQQTLPFVAGAIVNVPSYADPYDTHTANTPIPVFVPWLPSQPGTGFDIPINGQRTQFIQTGSLDFSGVTTTMNIDYVPVTDATGALTDGIIAAVETQDFLGEVFPCVDAATGDILRAKMYSSALDIVTWLEQHPGAQTACNIFIRYSPYDNYPDYITSVTNGLLLSVNRGAGDGPSRIGDATIFNPTLLTQTQ
jgi:hypothetical protein